MRSHEDRRPSGCLARLARRLGFDRNPLRRGTCLLSWLVLLASSTLARRALDRRRLSAWDAEWRASGPLWSGRQR
jgi:hypothetical protein